MSAILDAALLLRTIGARPAARSDPAAPVWMPAQMSFPIAAEQESVYVGPLT